MKLSIKEKAKELRREFSRADKITLITHTHPDGDAIGSSMALGSYLTSIGKDAMVLFPDPIPYSLEFLLEGDASFMACPECTEEAQDRLLSSELIVCLDFNSPNRAARLENSLRQSRAKKILIDHHIGPEEESFNVVASETEVSSASELLYWLLLEMPEVGGNAQKLTPYAAEMLMAGMATDTNNFSNSTYPSTFEMASGLLAAGVDRESLLQQLYNEYNECRIRLLGMLLHDRLRILDSGVAYMIMNKTDLENLGATEADSEGFVNIPLSIGKVKISIFLKEETSAYRVSIRSKKGWSANTLAMEYFNGGGHENAAGGTLWFGKDLPGKEDAAAYVEVSVTKYLKK